MVGSVESHVTVTHTLERGKMKMVGKMNMKIVVGMKQKIMPVVDIKLDELNYRKIKRLNISLSVLSVKSSVNSWWKSMY